MVEASSRISESIIENLSLTWQMYKGAINNIPDKEWRTGEIDYLIPARLILHGLEVLDYYSTTTPEISIQGYQFKLDDQKIPAEKLPNQEVLQINTMCGHGMVAVGLIEEVIADVKAGECTAEEGAERLFQPCMCGIFNPHRATRLLKAAAATV